MIMILTLTLFSLNFVFAEPPFQEGAITFTEGYFVEFEEVDVHKRGEDIIFQTHVFNISTGIRLTNTSTSCTIDVYNEKGEHLIDETPMDYHVIGRDWELTVAGGNFTTNEEYGYIIICNDSRIGGFASVGFDITGTGFKLTEARVILSLGLLALLVFLFMVTIGTLTVLPSKNNVDEEGTLLSINQLKYLRPIIYSFAYLMLTSIMFISSNIALGYLGTKLIGDILFVIFQMMLMFSPLMIILWLLFIFYSIFQDNELKKHIERGAFEP